MRSAWKILTAAFAAVFSVALWTLWLALAALIAVQGWWLAAREVKVPAYALRAIEARVAASGLSLNVGRTSFDPSGNILIEDIALRAPSFNEPLITARSAYVRVNPWELLVGRFEPREIRVSDLSCFVPAMLSSTGHAEPILRNISATIVPLPKEVSVPQLTARLGDLDITLHGAVRTDAWPARKGTLFPFSTYLVQQYPELSQRLAGYSQSIAMLDAPRLEVELEPSETAGAIVHTSVYAHGFNLAKPVAASARGLVASTVLPLRATGPVAVAIEASSDRVDVPGDLTADGVRTSVRGTIRTDTWAVEPESADIAIRSAGGHGFSVGAAGLSARREAGRTIASVATTLEDAPVSATADLDPGRGEGRIQFETAPTPRLVASLSRFTSQPIEDSVRIGPPPQISGFVQLDPGWKLAGAEGIFTAREVEARGITFDTISGRIRYAGNALEATDLSARVGQNAARGSYTMNLENLDYRFLLTGHLQPLDITPWFHEWWPRFFGRFEFSAPPDADVDVAGRWGSPYLSTVFVAAKVGPTTIEKIPFDSVQTRLFIRPDFYDALDFRLTRGTGVGSGTFTRAVDLDANEYKYMDFAVDSTLDEQSTARIFGQSGADIVAPFQFAQPPQLRIVGHLDGPAAKNGEHQVVHVEGKGTGGFSLYDFPLSDPVFKAELKDDDLRIDPISVQVAGGTATGTVHRFGKADARQLEFALDIKDAKLGPAVEVLGNYLAKRNNTTAPSRSALVAKAADSQLNLSASARGNADDALSFHGTGVAEVNGPQLGEVRMLGELSRVLSFTSLRFTRLQTGITIDGPKLIFPNLVLTGANSAVNAKGAYALDNKTLDFLANVAPFGQSKALLPALLDTVLKPITDAFEVSLSGTFDEPKWALTVSGPNPTLRALLDNPAPPTPDLSSAPALTP